MKPALFLGLFALGALALGQLLAQSPRPIIVQAMPAAGSATPAVARPPAGGTGTVASKDILQLVREMQATNAATIKKQEAALLTLDALQKAAEDIKIYSKRG
ncbi:MAG TPA: hypothetical protein VH207_11270 [Chthoniobacterales bacterium]|jgi:hypothetical protein|nr:hypothetical protein [Chthoniobacterales bacterium]